MQTPSFVTEFRSQFPFFKQTKECYLDNAATTHICQAALDAINRYYQFEHATVHRSTHNSAKQNTNKFELCRQRVADYFHLMDKKQVIWTKGATESANIIAKGLCNNFLQVGDQVLLGAGEHHAHHVTWIEMAKQYQLELKFIPLDKNLQLDTQALTNLVSEKTKVVAISHVANSTGVLQPIETISKICQPFPNLKLIVDGSQAVCHQPVNFTELAVDFYFFSAHKMYSGTGLGVLLGQEQSLSLLTAPLYGGEMVNRVSYTEVNYNSLPYYLEAGTPNIAAVHAFAATLDWLKKCDLSALHHYQHSLLERTKAKLSELAFINLLGEQQLSAVSFTIDGMHPTDASELLGQMHVAIRTGFHCAMPIVSQLSGQGTLRVSIAPYNTVEEVDYFVECIKKLAEFID
ncbi:aminotransferase class V-fold PLP-dependent enzyme [Catenovulum agarivorans]|uniref:aminotransferase class V-fold PLP-dependent enzyme n=1 Tax=Catenovulum agarivorans TaxID=1172192 RepID=UPI0003046021|nr:aminotransferase class V-fold PLP-dependent enzyme [Catenovulum agarivorans]